MSELIELKNDFVKSLDAGNNPAAGYAISLYETDGNSVLVSVLDGDVLHDHGNHIPKDIVAFVLNRADEFVVQRGYDGGAKLHNWTVPWNSPQSTEKFKGNPGEINPNGSVL